MGSFVVCVHDVAPVTGAAIEKILDRLAPLVGTTISLAIIPRLAGRALADNRSFTTTMEARSEEILLHGYTHVREQGAGLVSFLTEGADEFSGLAEEAALASLRRGRQELEECFEQPVLGFLPPAWQKGKVNVELLSRAELDFLVTFFSVHSVRARVPLATWTWDCGRFSALGAAGEIVGSAVSTLRPDAIPVLALHPRDLERGWLELCERRIVSFLKREMTPTTFVQAIRDYEIALGLHLASAGVGAL